MHHARVGRAAPRARSVGRRRIRISALAAAASLASYLLVGGVEAQTFAALPSATRLAGTGRAAPTPAWIDFCRRFPVECAIDPAEPAVVALSPRVWDDLVAVNREVNERIKPMTDQEHWGVVDRWDFPEDGY